LHSQLLFSPSPYNDSLLKKKKVTELMINVSTDNESGNAAVVCLIKSKIDVSHAAELSNGTSVGFGLKIIKLIKTVIF
jgi:hypothetical protein